MPEKEISDIDRAKVIIALANRAFGKLAFLEYKGVELSHRPGKKIYPETIKYSPRRIQEMLDAGVQALGTLSLWDDHKRIEEHAFKMTVLNEHYNFEEGKVIPFKKVVTRLRRSPTTLQRLEQEVFRQVSSPTSESTPKPWIPLKKVFNKYSR